MKNRILAALAILSLAGCAHPGNTQVPPASPGYEVVLTGGVPQPAGNWAGCVSGQPQCTYAAYSETITGTTCDPTTSGNYKEITNPVARPTTPTFTDSLTTGLTKCYDMETVQAGANSGPSNVAGPIVSPGIPLAPNLATPTPQAADLEKPVLPNQKQASQLPTSAMVMAPSGLKVSVSRRDHTD